MPVVPIRDDGDPDSLCVGRAPLCIEDVLGLAEGRIRAALDPDPGYRARLERGAAAVERGLDQGRAIYGVSTGVGASVDTAIPDQLRDLLPLNVVRFHGCGTGRILDESESAAVVAVRLASLARGYSRCGRALERLCEAPAPTSGSAEETVARQDLAPCISRRCCWATGASLRGELLSAAAHRPPVSTAHAPAREGLAIMNGPA
jgi:histidine ammonia-lyase